MTLLDDISAMSRAARPHIVLSEGEDERVAEAGLRAAADGLATITLLGDPEKIGALIEGRDGAKQVLLRDPADPTHLDRYAAAFFELRKHKGIDLQSARQAMSTGLGHAAMMVRAGDADGTLGGAVATTSDTVRAALQIIGKAPDTDIVSSCFLLVLAEPYSRPVIFADCGLVIQPDANELASIALASAQTLTALTGEKPKIAMLSFSTKGSVAAQAHESLGRIQSAIDLIKARAPELTVDGELQFDAAIVPEVAARKAPGSPVEGSANIFVFPSLSAGNIGYKIAQRLGGAVALGPILQGLAKPANDLSRGCSADDVYKMIAITGAQVATT